MRILIVGGTGTLGKALIEHYYDENNEVICYSRDESKQQDLKKKYPFLTCQIGDIRDGISTDLYDVIDDIDIVYHVAALKHIDVIEDNIIEALRTNFYGLINTANWAVSRKIPKFAFSSTDKAVYPINVYGHSKAIGERYLFNLNDKQSYTHFSVFRWGNVIASRGSVIHSFKNSLLKEKKVYITHPDMTRFWIRIEDAVNFMVENTENPAFSEPLIPDMKSCKVYDIARMLAYKLNIKDFDVKYIGLRPGEKIHESITEDRDSLNAERYTDDEILELLQDVV